MGAGKKEVPLRERRRVFAIPTAAAKPCSGLKKDFETEFSDVEHQTQTFSKAVKIQMESITYERKIEKFPKV